MFPSLEVGTSPAHALAGGAEYQRATLLGSEKTDGRFVEGENHHRVVSVLELHQKGEIGTREAARRLDYGTATINRALDRADLFRL